MSKTSFFVRIYAVAVMILVAGCGGAVDKKGRDASDTPTQGRISISVDETFAPILDSQLQVFHSQYPNAHINVKYESEVEAVNSLLNDSVRLAIITRTLNEKEEARLNSQGGYKSYVHHLATDAVAVIAHPSNKDLTMSFEDLQSITTGKQLKWKNGKNIQIVFDNPNSSTVRYIKDSLNKGTPLPQNTFATKTNKEVITHVEKTPGAIGFIGVNWISDFEDKEVQAFLSKVTVVGINPPKGQMGYGEPYQPYSYDVARKLYPLRRSIYSVSREARAGLGSGLISFLAGDVGQRIFLKGGLLPANTPIRIIKIKE